MTKLGGGDTATGESVFEEEDLSGEDPLEDDWKIAIDYYPELEKIEQRLRKTSWRLAYSFKATLIELKNFDHAQKLADELTKEFFERYFGSEKEFLAFATMVVDIGRKDIALELNTAIRFLGEKKSEQIINRTCKKYPDVAIKLWREYPNELSHCGNLFFTLSEIGAHYTRAEEKRKREEQQRKKEAERLALQQRKIETRRKRKEIMRSLLLSLYFSLRLSVRQLLLLEEKIGKPLRNLVRRLSRNLIKRLKARR